MRRTDVEKQLAQPTPDAWVIPSIDTQLGREIANAAGERLATCITRAVEKGLADANKRGAFVWTRVHGINPDGTMGASWTYSQIAESIGVTREYIENLYYRASHHVRGRIAVALVEYNQAATE